MSEFRFTVLCQKAYDDEPERWSVSLPHQCDLWEITRGLDGDTHPEAIASLETFIAEAQQAMVALRQKKELQP